MQFDKCFLIWVATGMRSKIKCHAAPSTIVNVRSENERFESSMLVFRRIWQYTKLTVMSLEIQRATN